MSRGPFVPFDDEHAAARPVVSLERQLHVGPLAEEASVVAGGEPLGDGNGERFIAVYIRPVMDGDGVHLIGDRERHDGRAAG